MAERTVIYTENVDNGAKANYPYESGYTEPTRQGCVFYGWKYNNVIYKPEQYATQQQNPFGPITGDVDISAIWENVNLYADTNHTIISGEGDDSNNPTKLYYWGSIGSVGNITNGITIEEVALDSDMLPINFQNVGTPTIENNKNVTTKKALPNDINKSRYYRFRAETNNYGHIVSTPVIEIEQVGVDQTVLPDFDFLTFVFNWENSDGRDLDTATYVLDSNIDIQYGEYKNKNSSEIITRQVYLLKTPEQRENYEPYKMYKLDKYPVGFNCHGCDGDPDYNNNTDRETFDIVSNFIKGAGDNTSSGKESALINWKEICNRDLISQGIRQLTCELYASWYAIRHDGNCSITFQTWKTESGSGGMQLDRGADNHSLYTFSPTGDTQLKTTVIKTGNVHAATSANATSSRDEKHAQYYSHVATLIYDIRSKSAKLINRMKDESTTPPTETPSGYYLSFETTVNTQHFGDGGQTGYSVYATKSKDFVGTVDFEISNPVMHIGTTDNNGIWGITDYNLKCTEPDSTIQNRVSFNPSSQTGWAEVYSITRDANDAITKVTLKVNSTNTSGSQRSIETYLLFSGCPTFNGTLYFRIYQQNN